MNREGRGATAPQETVSPAPVTFTGNRALDLEEGLLFEIGRTEVTGVDLDEPEAFTPRLGGWSAPPPCLCPASPNRRPCAIMCGSRA